MLKSKEELNAEGWISVQDAMPEPNMFVLTLGGDYPDDRIVCDYFSEGMGDWMNCPGDPLYWKYEEVKRGCYFWTTKDKQRLDVNDMESSHLLNCIKLVRRNAEKLSGNPPPNIMAEGSVAYDMVDDLSEQEIDDPTDPSDLLPPIYMKMKAVLLYRQVEIPEWEYE